MPKPNTIGLGDYTTSELVAEVNERLSKVTNRFEVIDDDGRSYVYGIPVVPELSLHDEDKTVKVFIKGIVSE